MYPSSIGAHNMRTLFQQPAAKQKRDNKLRGCSAARGKDGESNNERK